MTLSYSGPTDSHASGNISLVPRPNAAGCFVPNSTRCASLYSSVYSGPQQMAIGYPEPRMICTQILSDCGHCSSGPSGVVDQSNARMSSPITPPPPSTDSINCVMSALAALVPNDALALCEKTATAAGLPPG